MAISISSQVFSFIMQCCIRMVSWYLSICDNRYVPHNSGTVDIYDLFWYMFTIIIIIIIIGYIRITDKELCPLTVDAPTISSAEM
jgi:hypothetical protein